MNDNIEIINEKSSVEQKSNPSYIKNLIENGQVKAIEYATEECLNKELLTHAIKHGYILTKSVPSITNNPEYIDIFIENKQLMQVILFFDKKLFDKKTIEKLIKNNYKITSSTPSWVRNNKEYIKIFLKNNELYAIDFMDEPYKEEMLKEKIKTKDKNQTVIEYLINSGYKLTSISPLSIRNNKIYIELLIRKGNYQAIDFATEEGLSYKNVDLAIKKGYKIDFTTSFLIRNNPNYVKIFLENNQLEILNYINELGMNQEIVSIALEKKAHKKIIEIINNNPSLIYLYTMEFYQKTRLYLSKEYELNIKHLDEFINIFGTSSIFYLENDFIKDAINLDDKSFEKYIELFNQQLTLVDVKNILYILEEQKYYVENPDVVEISKNIKEVIITGSKISPSLEETIKKLTKNDYEMIINKIEIVKNKFLSDKQLDMTEINKYINLYIKLEKTKYIQEKQKTLEELNCDFEYDEEQKNKEILKILIKQYPQEITKKETIEIISKKLNIEEKQLKTQLNFIISPTEENNHEITSKIKEIKKILIKLIEKGYFKEQTKKIEKKLEISGSPNLKTNKLEILIDVNPNELKNKILNKEEKYNKLLEFMKKYKFISWGNIFSKIGEQIDINCDNKAVINLINNYYRIDQNEKLLLEQLKQVEIYSSVSDIYTNMFGQENCAIIKQNPRPYSGTASRRERLEKSAKYTLNCFEREYITIPPLNEIYEINGKKVLINLGEISDPINLSSAERIKLCSRIGGLGETLLDFCLTNENGGILKFINPINNNLINRILIFRKENNVYFNILDMTYDEMYYNEEIIKLTEIAAQQVIEKSEQSQYPINNVFIAKDGVMKNSTYPLVKLDSIPSEGLGQKIYCDIHEQALLLATNNKKEKRTNQPYLPKYKVLRNVFLSNEEQIMRLKVMDIYLKTREYKDIAVNEEKIIYSEVGKDWYVYINENNEIKSTIIKPNLENITEYRRATQKALEKLEKLEKMEEISNGRKK